MFLPVFCVGMFVLILWEDFLRKRLWFFGLVVDWVGGLPFGGRGLIGEVWFMFFGVV